MALRLNGADGKTLALVASKIESVEEGADGHVFITMDSGRIIDFIPRDDTVRGSYERIIAAID